MFTRARELLRKNKLVIKYILGAFTASVVDLLVFYILAINYRFWYLGSAAAALVVSYTIAFIIQKYWTFGDYSEHDLHGQFFRYALTVSISIVLNLGMLSLLVEYTRFNYLLSQALALFIAGIFGFILNVRNVFSQVADDSGVVIAAGIYPPEIGGPASQVEALARGLLSRGVRVSVVTYAKSRPQKPQSDVIDVTRIPLSWPIILRGPSYLTFLFIGAVKHHNIFAQDITATGLPASIVKKILPHKRFVIRIGGDLLWERKVESGEIDMSLPDYYAAGRHAAERLYKIGRKVMELADEIIVPAEFLKRVYVEYYGIAESKVTVIRNQLPVSEHQALAEGDRGSRIIFAGRFIKLKNIDKLLSAFARVREDLPAAKLTLIGDGPEKKSLELKIKSERLEGVEVLPTMPRQELLAEIAKSAVCACPSKSEVNSNFALECLAAGRPVLMTKYNGLSVKLPEEMLASPDDVEELADKLKALLSGHYDSAGLKHIVQTELAANSWEHILDQYSNVFGI